MRTRMPMVAAALATLVGLAGCTGDEKPTTRATPTTGSAPGPSGSAGQPGTSARSPASTVPEAGRPTATDATLLPGAGVGAKTSSVHQGFPVLVGVRSGAHSGFTRYVFDFMNEDPEGHSPLGSARPAWDVRYVAPSEVVQDGSGAPAPVGGAAHLRIRFDGADAHHDDGTSSIRYGLDAHAPLAFAGDFEGRVTWFLGLDRERPFNVFFVENNKVAVDVAQP